MAKTKKYYVVWQGHQRGVFDNWATCKKQIDGFTGAQYKSFLSKSEAEEALLQSYHQFIGKNTTKPVLEVVPAHIGKPILHSLAVDAACSGNPGLMEYRGVFTESKTQVFIQGPFKEGTNNIGEFLALVHGLAFLQKKQLVNLPIYSDSKIAISWVQAKQCRTKVIPTAANKVLYDLIKRAELWLQQNSYQNPILKWETKYWGEIPADFGRK